MKASVILLFFTLFSLFSFAQCTVNAGADVQICPFYNGKFDTVQLNPIVNGTVGPIKAVWDFKYQRSFPNIYTFASMILDDTSIVNPKIRSGGGLDGSWIPLSLTITDSLGNQCTDTVRFRVSNFFVLATDCIDYIKRGDSSILFSPVDGGIPPTTYTWTSNNGEPVPASLIVKPQRTTFYSCEAKDSIGCSITTTCRIFVDTSHVGLQEVNENKINALVLPNPFTQTFSILYDNPNNANYTFYLYDMLGKQIETRHTNNANETFILTNCADGTYILAIEDEYKNIVFKQRLKKE